MKKVFSMVVAMLLAVAVFVMSVSAAPSADTVAQKDRIMKAISQTINKDGSVWSFKDADIQKMQNYLDAYVQDNEITQDQADTVIKYLNQGRDYVLSTGVSEIYDMTSDQKRELLGLANLGADPMGLIVTANSTRDGIELYLKSDPSTPIYSTNLDVKKVQSPIKQTGDPVSPYVIPGVFAGLVLLTGAAFVFAKRQKLYTK